ncbi:MAG: PEGA domain-containing protein [Fibromonadales bacterium]|nr:PEGA domain-containing protein [Fibromonadales bacterium]
MKKLGLMLLLAFAINIAFAQKTSVAVLPSDGAGASLSAAEENALTDKVREMALKVLPSEKFVLLTQNAVMARLGGAENYVQECKESSCIVDLGKKAQVDYVAQASVGKLGNKMRLKVELYNVSTEGLVGIFNGDADNIYGLSELIDKNVPDVVFRKIPGATQAGPGAPVIVGGISGVQSVGGAWEADAGKRRLVNLATEPAGASLSFNGLPSSSCAQSPCRVELPEGKIRIIAALEQYEIADTTVSVERNNQNINIKLKPNFGVLDIRSAYSDGMGRHEEWNLTINDKAVFSLENRLSPDKYRVKLSHRCYEDISFEVGINKGSHEIFDIARHIKQKQGGLVLSTERDGEPSSEPVFVNGKRVGETPYSGTVATCAEIELGRERVKAKVRLEHKETVTYKHNMPDSQEWLAMMEEKRRREAETAEERRRRETIELIVARRSEAERTAWQIWGIIGFGGYLNMDDIDPTLYKSSGGHFLMAAEFYRQDIRFIRYGLHFEMGMIGVDEDEIVRRRPNIITDSIFSFNMKLGTSLKLHPVEFLFLSGGASWGWYKIDSHENKSGGDTKKVNVASFSTPVFGCGGGLLLGGDDFGLSVEGLYNIVPFQGRVAAYISIAAGVRIRKGLMDRK